MGKSLMQTHVPTGVQHEIPCSRCGYNLHTLPAEGRCPECGSEVRLSLRGRRLIHADARWFRSLTIGALLSGSSVAVSAAVFPVASARMTVSGAIFSELLLAAMIFQNCLGTWLLTSAEPHGPYFDDHPWTRRVTRALSITGGLSFCIFLADTIARQRLEDFTPPSLTMMILVGTGLILTLLGIAITPWYLSLLARRKPSNLLKVSGQIAAFTLPALYASLILLVATSTSPVLVDAAELPVTIVGLATPGAYSICWALSLRHSRTPRRT